MTFAKHLVTVGLALSATGLLSCSIPKPECTVGAVGFTGQAFTTRYIPKGATDDMECEMNVGAGAVCDVMGTGTCIVTIPLVEKSTTYKWSNLKFYVTAGALGTQFTGDVDITIDGCTASYTAVGMWPALHCEDYEAPVAETCTSDGECAGLASPNCVPAADAPCERCMTEDEAGGPGLTRQCIIRVPAYDQCNPEADAKKGRPFGSGINPDFGPIKCDDSFAVVEPLDDWYLNFITGAPLSAPHCTLATDTIPAIGGYSETPPP
jgi:hypothetical protein